MSSSTVPKRINDFLVQRSGRMYCDVCIQERLGLRWRQQVQLITATLAVTTMFERGHDECCTCHEMKQVIKANKDVNSKDETPRSDFILTLKRLEPNRAGDQPAVPLHLSAKKRRTSLVN